MNSLTLWGSVDVDRNLLVQTPRTTEERMKSFCDNHPWLRRVSSLHCSCWLPPLPSPRHCKSSCKFIPIHVRHVLPFDEMSASFAQWHWLLLILSELKSPSFMCVPCVLYLCFACVFTSYSSALCLNFPALELYLTHFPYAPLECHSEYEGIIQHNSCRVEGYSL